MNLRLTDVLLDIFPQFCDILIPNSSFFLLHFDIFDFVPQFFVLQK